MILQLIKRDPASRFTPWLLAAAVLAAAFGTQGDTGAMIAGFFVSPFFVVFMFAQPHQRATFFEAALPVSARDLILARFLSLMALIWLPAGTAIAVLGAAGKAAASGAAMVAGATAMTLVVVLILSVRITEFAAPAWLTLASPVAAVSLLVPAISGHYASEAAELCAMMALVWAFFSWRKVPEAFQSAPIDAGESRIQCAAGAPATPWWPVIRSLLPWQSAIFVPLSFIWIGTGEWFWGPMYLMMARSQTRITTQWTRALPISHRFMMAASILPLLVVLAFGAELGMLRGFGRMNRDMLRLGNPNEFRATGALEPYVDPTFWLRAPAGRVPVIRAPWGETVQPVAHEFLGLIFYNPYYVGPLNSLRFQDWQFERASTRIFGRALPDSVVYRSSARTLRPVTVQPRMQVISIAAVLFLGMLWAWLVELLSWHRLLRLSKPVRWGITYTLMAVPLLGILGLDLFVGGHIHSVSRSLCEWILLAASRHLPGNPILLAGSLLLPLAAMYWVLERQAEAAEVTVKLPQNQTMFNWGSLGSRS